MTGYSWQRKYFIILQQIFFQKIVLKYKFFPKSVKLPKISLDIRDIFKNLSLKSEYPLNRGSLNRGFLTLEKPEKFWDQTVLSLKCGYPLNRGATKVGFHCISGLVFFFKLFIFFPSSKPFAQLYSFITD